MAPPGETPPDAAGAGVEIACRLDASALGAQLAQWSDVLTRVIDRESTETGWRLHFAADAGFAASLADLAVRETRCCPFFRFAIGIDGTDRLTLDASTTPDALPLLAGLLGAG